MEKDNFKEFMQLCMKKEPSFEDGQCLGVAAESLVNSFHHNEIKEAYAILTPTGRKRLRTLACLIGHRFAAERIYRGEPTWDERKKASEQFSLQHDSEFFEVLRKEGIMSSQDAGDNFTHFFSLTEEERKTYWRSWMYGFMSYWTDFHSTLKQSFFQQMCVILCEEGVLHCEAPRFPFI